METLNIAAQAINPVSAEALLQAADHADVSEATLSELTELQLALVGGGSGVWAW